MEISNFLATLFIVMGVLVFLVNVVVQVTKEMVPIKTDYYVLGVSILLCVLSYLVYIGYTSTPFAWHCLIASVILGFLVCYVAQNGWEKFIKLWEQSQNKKGE